MPELHWPQVLVLSAALLLGFLWLDAWLKRRPMRGLRRRQPQHGSTTRSVSLRPTLPQKVITHSTGHPPWEDRDDWPAKKRPTRREKQAFETELDEAFLPVPTTQTFPRTELTHDQDLWWVDETPSQMRPLTDDFTMLLSVTKPTEMPLECRSIKQDLTVPAGEIHWKACQVTTPTKITRVEITELVLF